MESLIHQIICRRVVPEGGRPGSGAINDHLGAVIVETAEVLDPGHQFPGNLVVKIDIRVRTQVFGPRSIQHGIHLGSRIGIGELDEGFNPGVVITESPKRRSAVYARENRADHASAINISQTVVVEVSRSTVVITDFHNNVGSSVPGKGGREAKAVPSVDRAVAGTVNGGEGGITYGELGGPVV